MLWAGEPQAGPSLDKRLALEGVTLVFCPGLGSLPCSGRWVAPTCGSLEDRDVGPLPASSSVQIPAHLLAPAGMHPDSVGFGPEPCPPSQQGASHPSRSAEWAEWGLRCSRVLSAPLGSRKRESGLVISFSTPLILPPGPPPNLALSPKFCSE